VLRFRLEGRGAIHEKLLEAAAAEEWLEELREILGPPEERDDWVWADSLVVRTFGETDWERLAEEDGFLGELTRLGLRTAGSPESARLLIEEALASLRRQPRIREWLSNLDDGQCAELVRRALETAVSMLRDDERI
jgi:hypothetical protein